MRSEVDVSVSNNVREFIEGMGYKFDFESVRRGTKFNFPGDNMTVEVFRLYKLKQHHILGSEELVSGSHWMVQIGAMCEDVHEVTKTCQVVSNVVDTLQPYFLQSL